MKHLTQQHQVSNLHTPSWRQIFLNTKDSDVFEKKKSQKTKMARKHKISDDDDAYYMPE